MWNNVSVVLSHPFCRHLLQEPQETNTETQTRPGTIGPVVGHWSSRKAGAIRPRSLFGNSPLEFNTTLKVQISFHVFIFTTPPVVRSPEVYSWAKEGWVLSVLISDTACGWWSPAHSWFFWLKHKGPPTPLSCLSCIVKRSPLNIPHFNPLHCPRVCGCTGELRTEIKDLSLIRSVKISMCQAYWPCQNRLVCCAPPSISAATTVVHVPSSLNKATAPASCCSASALDRDHVLTAARGSI